MIAKTEDLFWRITPDLLPN